MAEEYHRTLPGNSPACMIKSEVRWRRLSLAARTACRSRCCAVLVWGGEAGRVTPDRGDRTLARRSRAARGRVRRGGHRAYGSYGGSEARANPTTIVT